MVSRILLSAFRGLSQRPVKLNIKNAVLDGVFYIELRFIY